MALLAGVTVGLGLLIAFDGLTSPPRAAPRLVVRVADARVAGALVAGAGAYAVTRWPIALVAGATLGAAAPAVIAEQRSLARRIELTDALAKAAASLRDAVRGGLGLSDGLAGLAAWGPPALRGELATLASDVARIGASDAARAFALRVGDPAAEVLAATIAFNDRVGGRHVAEVLDALADELQAEAATVRELRARQAHQKTSARVVALAPVVLLLLLRQVNPGYLGAYDSPGGQLVLGIAAALIGLGYAAMLRIGRAIEPPRVAVGHDR